VGILFGFVPWVVYWVFVGNIPFTVAVLVALVIAVAPRGIPRRLQHKGALTTVFLL
jgi:hypothetical protein